MQTLESAEERSGQDDEDTRPNIKDADPGDTKPGGGFPQSHALHLFKDLRVVHLVEALNCVRQAQQAGGKDPDKGYLDQISSHLQNVWTVHRDYIQKEEVSHQMIKYQIGKGLIDHLQCFFDSVDLDMVIVGNPEDFAHLIAKRYRGMRAEKEKLQEENLSFSHEIQRLTAEKDSLQKDNLSFSHEIQRITDEKDRLQEENLALSHEIQRLTAERDRISQTHVSPEVGSARQKETDYVIAQLKAEILELSKANADYCLEIAGVRNQGKALHIEKVKAEEKSDILAQRNNKKSREIERLTHQVETLKQDVGSKIEADNVKDGLARTNDHLYLAIADLRSSVDALQRDDRVRTELLRKVEAERDTIKAIAKDQGKALSSSHKIIAMQSAHICHERESFFKEREVAMQSDLDLAKSREDCDRVRASLAQEQLARETISTLLCATNREKHALLSEDAELKEKIETLRKDLSHKEDQLKMVETARDVTVARLEERIKILEAEKDDRIQQPLEQNAKLSEETKSNHEGFDESQRHHILSQEKQTCSDPSHWNLKSEMDSLRAEFNRQVQANKKRDCRRTQLQVTTALQNQGIKRKAVSEQDDVQSKEINAVRK
ncbi:hypothetical protein Z517_04048 [Fonsecaea pedrosoi CBS 271.37]|uniref:Unplaced genomic scaffold supercont1.3, whole genome shotgun sequence n=1 Tax=Fonsecaea pedrosoi CBS 271.37 TaxID=1442368 RepID=A0A0D2GR57_9EURO|nr:uncharacterized protein Z517_04048 [Fonsecaea pedrosoi CBS 271.37]KIW81025.1 hypothetical protein Z517_04048 [Fonsecaea pedrosoi CBS 271.37]